MEIFCIGTMGDDLHVWRSLFSLIIVLGAMFGVMYWLRRRGCLPGAVPSRMRVIERLPLDTRRQILLVDIDGRELVLGVTQESISMLQELRERRDDEA
jgi:flagellar protein FliO/FliZ